MAKKQPEWMEDKVTDLWEGFALLEEIGLALTRYNVKCFKGKRRYARMLQTLKILSYRKTGTTVGVEELFQKQIRDATELFRLLPQRILDAVPNLEDLYFGDFSAEAKRLLKEYYRTKWSSVSHLIK